MRNSPGFTLIELLVVVVIVGILAAVAMPKFGAAREAAHYSMLKADLNNLRGAQEIYYQMSGANRYATDVAQVEWESSSGVTLGAINVLNSGQAWEVVATHKGLATGACVIGSGVPGADAWTASGGTPVVAVTDANAGSPICND